MRTDAGEKPAIEDHAPGTALKEVSLEVGEAFGTDEDKQNQNDDDFSIHWIDFITGNQILIFIYFIQNAFQRSVGDFDIVKLQIIMLRCP